MKKNIANLMLLSMLAATALAITPPPRNYPMPGAPPVISPQVYRNTAEMLRIWIEFVEQMSNPQGPIFRAYMAGLGTVTPLNVSPTYRAYIDDLKQRAQELELEAQWLEEMHQSVHLEPIDSHNTD